MASLEDLLSQQEHAMNSVSRALSNFKKLGRDKRTPAIIRRRMTTLQETFQQCQDLDVRILRSATELQKATLTYFQANHFVACEDMFNEAIDCMAEVLSEVEPSIPLANSTVATEATGRPLSRLPQLNLPTFDGELSHWETFRDRFRSMIHFDRSLSGVERLHYLCSCLRGEPSQAIGHLSLTNANYEVAWNILISRFENKRLLVGAHLHTLQTLPAVHSESAKDLRTLRDTAQSTVNALRNLDRPVDHWDDVLIHFVVQKLDRNTRKAWELNLGDIVDCPTFDSLNKFLDKRIRGLDALPSLPSKRESPASCSVRPSRSQHLTSHTTTTTPVTTRSCPACKANHSLSQCQRFKSFSVQKRNDFAKSQRRCFNCLASGHALSECTSVFRCRECSQKHHTLLHPKGDAPSAIAPATPHRQASTDSQSEVASHALSKVTNSHASVMLATARVLVRSEQGRVVQARALLDQGSVATLLTENLAQLLRLQRQTTNVCITGLGDSEVPARQTATITITPRSNRNPSYTTQAIILHSLTRYLPPRLPAHHQWPHTVDLQLADCEPSSGDPIDVIIGADLYGELLRPGLRRGKSNEPTAQNTAFGWILSGNTSVNKCPAVISCNHYAVDATLSDTLRKFWEIEDVPSPPFLARAEQQAEDHFLRTHRRDAEGRYIVRLPFQEGPPLDLGESKPAARASLFRLRRRLDGNESRARDYAKFIEEYEQLGHMEKVSSSEGRDRTPSYYIPHHAVYRDSSSTSKLRVVFNASALATNGKSLNEHLLVGPKLQSDLSAILIRWRQHKYVFTADIEKMYRQIRVDQQDVDYQRILWQTSSDSPVEEYRLLTVTYGTTSAPFLALRVLRQLVVDEGASYLLATPVVLHQSYVDDFLFGASTVEVALETRSQVEALLRKAGFHLRKWASNDPALIIGIDPRDHGLIRSRELPADDSLSILGVVWNPDQDDLRFRLGRIPPFVSTKRAILSTIAHLYDPLGWVTPVVIVAKILLQRLWQLRCDWDEEVPPSIGAEWSGFHTRLSKLQDIKLPRWTEYEGPHCRVELHGFSDASTTAYAAAVYLRVIVPHKRPTTSLLIAKSKVAPLKTISVPRLELCAAHLLARLTAFVRSSLHLSVTRTQCWTDSTIVLAWLSQPPARWKTFVANRVSQIQHMLDGVHWRHVPTADNPADCASRGLEAGELAGHALWWNGPPWLSGDADSWPSLSPLLEANLPLEEKQFFCAGAATVAVNWDLPTRFSSWRKLLRVTAYIMRFINRLKSRCKAAVTLAERDLAALSHLHLQSSELDCAKLFWLRYIQASLFPQERARLERSLPVSKGSPLAPLCPFLDSDGLLRVRGRLHHASISDSSKQPIVLQSHELVRQIILEVHLRALHAGPQLTLAILRREYWLLRARATVRSVLHRCIACTRANARTSDQIMGDLPRCRVTMVPRAFTHTGVDYAGPVLVRSAPGRGHKSHKAYIALFICMTTKAVHLDLVSDYSSSAFVAAYHRFVSRRGLPTTMYSDNGTTFQGADRELQASHKAAVKHPDFVNRLAGEGVTWHFIPPAAPHFGGLWEAAVRSVKHHLRRCMGAYTLTFEELSTLLCRVEACLNSRPIAALSDSLDDYQPLTPGHLLIGAPLLATPEPGLLAERETRLNRWQLVQRITEDFWATWRRDYLHTLQQRPKWRVRQQLARKGQIVLISDPNAPPSHWVLGRITACHPGDDGLTRVVTVKTATTELKRPIVKLCFLPVDINSATDSENLTAGGVSPATE